VLASAADLKQALHQHRRRQCRTDESSNDQRGTRIIQDYFIGLEMLPGAIQNGESSIHDSKCDVPSRECAIVILQWRENQQRQRRRKKHCASLHYAFPTGRATGIKRFTQCIGINVVNGDNAGTRCLSNNIC